MLEVEDMDPATLHRVLGLVQAHTGMVMHDAKRGMLQTRLRGRMRKLGISSYRDYAQRVTDDHAEVPSFVDVVTTHQTAFFRTPALWRYFSDEALPGWLADNPGARLRIWSAAGSTGEEACTIAMCCEEARRAAGAELAWEIQCTDISAAAMEQARLGRYGGAAAGRFLATWPALYARYNSSTDKAMFELPPALRATLRFGTHNLLDPCPWPQQFDMVFLRNVLIYFDGDEFQRIVQAALSALRPQGLLIVGEAESLRLQQGLLGFVRPQVYRRLPL